MKELNTLEFEELVLKGEKMVIDFFSTECPPCEAVAPKFEGAAEAYGNEIQFYKMYRQGNRELAEKLGVKSSPTLLFFENGKEVCNRLNGGIKRSDIIANLNTMISEERAKEIHSSIKPVSLNYDVVILGGGPAGLTAGIYLSQAKLKTLIIDPSLAGGQVSTTHEVSNYPGFIGAQKGFMLSHYFSEQAKENGCEFKLAVDVTSVDLDTLTVVIDGFETIKAKKIIIATGTTPNTMGVPGEAELKGNGISYCATCDAKYFDDKEVIVIGGGNSAVEESDFISKFASKITIIHQFDQFNANKLAQERLFENEKISTLFSHEPRGFKKEGDKILVEVEDLKSKQLKTLKADGVFSFIGWKANIGMFSTSLKLNDWGFVEVNEDMQTNIPNIYAVGDVIAKKYRQITTAVADGTIAAMAITNELG
jgi:thioredoxin reductase (NADPH)